MKLCLSVKWNMTEMLLKYDWMAKLTHLSRPLVDLMTHVYSVFYAATKVNPILTVVILVLPFFKY